ncbi:hypothetical protein [Nostoc sp. UHCC 0252]|nr:hypothetical protein [Nostoc sp. UHCC 0252]MEA5599933.1 hypothetical protein [Nostoc sp. UHCC 0252]
MTTNLAVATEIIPIVLQLQPAIAMTNDQCLMVRCDRQMQRG